MNSRNKIISPFRHNDLIFIVEYNFLDSKLIRTITASQHQSHKGNSINVSYQKKIFSQQVEINRIIVLCLEPSLTIDHFLFCSQMKNPIATSIKLSFWNSSLFLQVIKSIIWLIDRKNFV